MPLARHAMPKLNTAFQVFLAFTALLLFSLSVRGQQIIYQDANRIVWRIDQPEVRQPTTDYRMITFRRLDEVVVQAGGCVQTGGGGETWKRYVNPSGPSSDRLYHGKIFIPGATAGMVRISSITSPYQPQPLHLVVKTLPAHYDGSPLYLQLGYEDDDFGGNGYEDHDDGHGQCRYENDGGPAWLIITIIHHNFANPPPPSPSPVAPMDLWWLSVDENFLPLNPAWWAQQPANNWAPPNANFICQNFPNPDDTLPVGHSTSCTMWDPEVNSSNNIIPLVCSSSGVRGHVNWAAATYTGLAYFKDYSGGGPFGDADYNFTLIRDDFKGVTTPTVFQINGREGIGLEFQTNETVDLMSGTNTWWDWLHWTVDNDENSIKGKLFGEAIVIGLLGLDHAHGAQTELHPVFGFGIHVADTPNDATWAIFARNWGNEGGCSQQEEFLGLKDNRMVFFIPKPPNTTIVERNSIFFKRRLDDSGYFIENRDDGVLLSRHLGVPWNFGLFWGELHLKKERADLAIRMTATPDPVVTGSNPTFTQGLTYTITISNNGPDRAHPVTLKDVLPASTHFISCSSTGTGLCTGTGNDREVRYRYIAPGTSVRATIRAYVDCALDTGETVSNTASVSSATMDPNPADNTATVQTTASDPPPVFTYVPPDVSVCTEPDATTCGTVVDPAQLGMATADDNCPGVTVERTGVPANNYYPVGTTVITYTARDSNNHTTVAHQNVIVRDCTPPVVTPLVIDKPVLWPANHQMQFVTVDFVATDNCPLPPNACVLNAISDEPIEGTGAGDFSPDWQIEDAHHAYIRSERAGDTKERRYTMTATCTDAAGNVTTKDSRIIVPVTAPLVEPEKTQQANLLENQLIGYMFYQPNNMTARNPFTFSDSADRRIVGGITTAGPIADGKAYWFSNYEYWSADVVQFRDYLSSPQLGPSAAQVNLLNSLDVSGDPNVRRIAANLRFALTTSANNYPTTLKLLTDNTGTFVSGDRLYSWMTRVDYQVTNRDWLMGRLSKTRRDTSRAGILYQASPSGSSNTVIDDFTTLLEWTHEVRPNFVNRLRFQFSPDSANRIIPGNPGSTSLSITDFALFGRMPDSPFRAKEDRFQFDDNLMWILPQHTISVGASYRAAKYNVSDGLGFAGDWVFSPGQFSVLEAVPLSDRASFLAAVGTSTLPSLTGLQSFNMNLPSQYRQGSGDPVWKARAQYLGVFAQDQWRTHPRLTINFGGRLDYAAEPSPLPHNGFFSPRLGVAWDVNGNGKTVIRGGVGTFFGHDDYDGALHSYLLGQNGKYINEILRTPGDGPESSVSLWALGRAAGILPFGSFSQADLQRLGIRTGPDATSRVLYEASQSYRNPYSVQASVGIQRTLGRNTSVEGAYLLYDHFRLPRTVETNYRESNLPNPAGSAFGPGYLRIDPNVAQLNVYQSTGRATYHGMTLSLNSRLANYFQFQVNHTFSKTIDDQFDGVESEPAFPTRLELERSLSSFDVRHNFVASGVFMGPLNTGADSPLLSRIFSNTTIGPIVHLRSGTPFTLKTGADTNGDTHLFDRLFTIGRNTGVGPDYRSVDMRLTKSFHFSSDDGIKLLLSADVENLFNRSNFAAVNEVLGTDPTSPDYNQATFRLRGRRDLHRTLPRAFTDAFPARGFQFGLKFVF